MRDLPYDDQYFCVGSTEAYEHSEDVDLISVLVVSVDGSMEKKLRERRDVKPPNANVRLLGYRYGQADCGDRTFVRDELVNHLVCEIYSLKHIVGFLGHLKTD